MRMPFSRLAGRPAQRQLNPSDGAVVDLHDATKRFGSTMALDSLSLAIRRGEFLVVLGPSGCGKSTMLRVIAGLDGLDSGTVTLRDLAGSRTTRENSRVAMVFQHLALYPHMTVRDNIAFGLRNALTPASEIDRRVSAVAERLEISSLLQRRPRALSGGQQQRVAIARALVKQPEIFLLDEPLSSLDAALRARLRFDLAELHRQAGTTTIFVTHDQAEAMTLADRIALMKDGRLEQLGNPIDLYCNPRTIFAAKFLGSPCMNLIPVVIEAERAGPVALVGSGNRLSLEGYRDPPLKSATLGVRAENLRLVDEQTGNLRGQVRMVERLGDRTLVRIQLTDGGLLTCSDAGKSVAKVGESVSVALDASSIRLFDEAGIACGTA